VEAGLYITFFESGEPFDKELPPVGPLDRVVVRHAQLIADRRALAHPPDADADIAKWLEAELEYQRATGHEPGGPKRSALRVAARDGVYLRFAVFDDEREPLAELGPFAVVVVTPGAVEADGQVLATRSASEIAWTLTAAAAPALAGLRRPDVALRTLNTSYHPGLAAPQPRAPETIVPEPVVAETVAPPPPAPIVEQSEPTADVPSPIVEPPSEFVFHERIQRAREVYSAPSSYNPPPAEQPVAAPPSDIETARRAERRRVEDSLRARVLEERERLGVGQADDAASATRYRSQGERAVILGASVKPHRRRRRLLIALIVVLFLVVAAVIAFTVINALH